MATFAYKSIDRRGKKLSGRMDAANESELETRLSDMGMVLITCKFVEQHSLFGRGVIRRIDLINFCFHMEQLTRSGVPILEGLEDLRDSVDVAPFRSVIATVISDIENGRTLSQALAEHPRVFDDMFVNLIAAGEASGQLPEIFKSLNGMLKWQDELIATTKRLLIFPAFVAVVVLFVIGFIMMYLVPQLVSFIESVGSSLPGHTRALIATSNFFIQYWYLFTILPAALVLLIQAGAKLNDDLRYRVDAFKLRLWQIGPLLQKIILSRFANFFAMMYRSGIPILQSVEITEKTVGNEAIRHALVKVREEIKEGKGVSSSFHNTGLFPPLVVRMVRVGETTGNLDEALLNVSYFYDRDIQDSIERMQAMIQPILTVFLGSILAWVMLSVMGPIYDTITNLQL